MTEPENEGEIRAEIEASITRELNDTLESFKGRTLTMNTREEIKRALIQRACELMPPPPMPRFHVAINHKSGSISVSGAIDEPNCWPND